MTAAAGTGRIMAGSLPVRHPGIGKDMNPAPLARPGLQP